VDRALLELIDPRHHGWRVEFMSVLFHRILYRPHLTVQTVYPRVHHPIVQHRKKPEYWVRHRDERNQNDERFSHQHREPERQLFLQERSARSMERSASALSGRSTDSAIGNCPAF
jgi:hypothetical protein